MKMFAARIHPWAWLVGVALLLDLVAVRTQIGASIDSAACLERAKFELILCAAAPADWQVALSGVLALALSIGLGALLASRWQRTS